MKVLLVRLSSMGDLIHTLPAVSDLARHRPDVELDWICEAGFADIARLHPFVRRVHVMRWRYWRKHLLQSATWQEMAALKRDLRQAQYRQVVDSQGLLKSAWFARWANAPITGLNRESARESWAAHWYRYTVDVPKGHDAVWRNRMILAQAFGYTIDSPPDFGVQIPEGAQGSLQLPDAYHVAAHATSRDAKLWPVDNWLALWRKQHEVDGLPVLLPWGSEPEKQRAQSIADQLPFAQVCPQLSLLQAAFLMKNARSIVGVDTGLLHLANAVNRPVVGIYTDSDPAKAGVQPSAWTANIGGIGQNPSAEEVFALLQTCLQNDPLQKQPAL